MDQYFFPEYLYAIYVTTSHAATQNISMLEMRNSTHNKRYMMVYIFLEKTIHKHDSTMKIYTRYEISKV